MDTDFENLLMRADALAGLGYSRFDSVNAVGLGWHFDALPENMSLETLIERARLVSAWLMPEIQPVEIVTPDDLSDDGNVNDFRGMTGDAIAAATGRGGYVHAINVNALWDECNFGCDELAHHSRAHFDAAFLRVVLHETLHPLVDGRAPAQPSQPNQTARDRLATQTRGYYTLTQALRDHDHRYLRLAIHADYRMQQAGIHLPRPILDPDDLLLGPIEDFRAAMDGEPWLRFEEPLGEILKTQPPTAFTKLWNQRRIDAITGRARPPVPAPPTNATQATFEAVHGQATAIIISQKE